MKILGVSADMAGCGYYRVALPMWALRTQLGHLAHESNRRFVPGYDLYVGQRIIAPLPSMIWADLKDRGIPRIFETDDDMLDLPPDNPSHWIFNTDIVRQNLITNMESADAITVTTDYLATKAREHNDNVHVLPNCVPRWLLTHPRSHRDRLVVGWAGSGFHHTDFKDSIRHITRWIDAQGDAVGFHVIGHAYKGMPKTGKFTPWCNDTADYYRAIDFDIGLCVLEPHRFNRSKSAIKALEYMALGIPVVATNFGPYADFITHGIDGFLVDRPHEWGKYLTELKDPELRARMGLYGRIKARRHVIEDRCGEWADVYEGVSAGLPSVVW